MTTAVLPPELSAYRIALVEALPTFLIPRYFTTNETWMKATAEGGTLYLSLFRDDAPDLAAILSHRRVLILGEPGSGKSTAARAIVQHVLNTAPPTHVPIIAALKNYNGDLRALLVQSTPAGILAAPELTRIYVLDGVDEIAPTWRPALVRELDELLNEEASAAMILTARQAFHAHHPNAFPSAFNAYHLLALNDADIRAFARHYDVNPDAFLIAVREVDCDEEIHNPFVLTVMVERYKEEKQLSPLRSDNVGYVIDRLIKSRPVFNAVQKSRALRMLAITYETAARNVLSETEAQPSLDSREHSTPFAARRKWGICDRHPQYIPVQLNRVNQRFSQHLIRVLRHRRV